MQPAERLAAYLADELATDERRALEHDLARDPALRADLEAMRRADDALSTVEPAALPDGADDRLRSALKPVLEAELGGSGAGATPVVDAADELAERRRRRASRRTWLTAAGGVAAAVLAVAVVVPSLTGSGDDSDEAAEDSAALTADDAEAGAGEAPADGGAIPTAPIVTGGDRELDAAGADELLAAPELEGLAGSGLAPEEAVGLASGWAADLGADAGAQALARTHDAATGEELSDAPAAEEAETEAAEGDAAEDEADDAATGSDAVFSDPSVDDAARADVGRCLDVLLATGDLAVPVTAELVVFDGEPSIAYGLVGRDADGQVSRREVWVLARESCEVRYFSQA